MKIFFLLLSSAISVSSFAMRAESPLHKESKGELEKKNPFNFYDDDMYRRLGIGKKGRNF